MTKEENGHLEIIKLEVKELRKDMEQVQLHIKSTEGMLKFILAFMALVLALMAVQIMMVA